MKRTFDTIVPDSLAAKSRAVASTERTGKFGAPVELPSISRARLAQLKQNALTVRSNHAYPQPSKRK